MKRQQCPKCRWAIFFILWSEEKGFFFQCQKCQTSDAIEFLIDPPAMVEKP